MNRRNFLTRSGLALGALIVGDEVLETLDRLTHRKVWALGAIPQPDTLPPLQWRWVRSIVASNDLSIVTLQGAMDAYGPWTNLESVPLINGTATFSQPHWLNATIIVVSAS